MALEDAIVLAKCLRDIPDLESAFATFEHLRRERTSKIYLVGLNGDRGKHMVQPFQVWLRDIMTPMMFKLFVNEKASRWLYSYQVDWDERVEATAPAANAQVNREEVRTTV